MSVLKIIDVELDDSIYQIKIGRKVVDDVANDVGKRTSNKKVLLVADSYFSETVVSRIERQFVDRDYEVYIYLMSAGKGNKTFSEALKIYGVLEESNLARDSTLISIGGGVIGDLAGFVASTWLRGMNLVHIPTTLMAMVDSSIGGKVAINYRNTINAVGNYYHPILNLMDLDLIDSLPDRDYRAGLAEVIKCGIINDADFYHYLEDNSEAILSRDPDHVVYFMSKTIEIKLDHVKGDIKEGGKRLLLNYGHTLGHSVEISTVKNHQEQYRHGEGVSIGIMAAAYIATHYLNLSNDAHLSYKNLFEAYGLPIEVESVSLGIDRKKILEDCKKNVHKDKKRINNKLRVILADKIGHASVYADVPNSLVEKAFEHIIK